MSTAAIVAIVVFVVIVLVAIAVFALAGRLQTDRAVGRLSRETRNRDRQARRAERRAEAERAGALVPAPAGDVEAWTPPDERELGVNRRQFLNRGILTLFGLTLLGFGGGVLSFLWPAKQAGFGSKITLGSLDDVKSAISKGGGTAYFAEAKGYVSPYPSAALSKAKNVYQPLELTGMEQGVVALYQKCVHLGCKVPFCGTSKWFECPCHGSQYSQVGEKKGGPAPRGLDHFAMDVSGGVLTVDTGNIILGPPIGTDTTGQEAEGPHCVG
jgi:cytochrome b6-f complex iron-sulfur subunit